jgi:hypothetical protein
VTAASEGMNRLPEFEKRRDSLKETIDQNLKDSVKNDDVARETSDIREKQSHCEGLASRHTTVPNWMRRSADGWETRTFGPADLTPFDDLWRGLVLKEGLASSGEKTSVFQIELKQGKEKFLWWDGFEAVPIPASIARRNGVSLIELFRSLDMSI